ncbi:hypothetical protein EVAR_73467_1 [Eumeta japonica]|uniref:Uncharacterized protein n=1 Tax=Eumeta variegata TaxID=151549 RepID=A0A4C1SXN0_EUMVA|nr:hypothetical protein EVAR_73467_1 [Eumeta japonica]
MIPQITEGLNAMLSNPAIHNMFSNSDIDLSTLQAMSENQAIMGAIGQFFAGLRGGGGGGMPDGSTTIPPMPNDMMQLFQVISQQLTNAAANQTENSANQPQSNADQNQPPSN